MTSLPPSTTPEPEEPVEYVEVPGAVTPRQMKWLWVVGIVVAILVFIGIQFFLSTVAPKDGGDATTSESAAPEASSDGYVYTNDDLGFTVTLPGEPEETTTVQSVAGFDIPLTQAQWLDGSNLAVVSAAEFPDEIMAQDMDTMLTNSIAGAATSTGGTVSEETATELAGAPAHRAVLALANGQTAEILVAFEGNLQVSIVAGGDVSLDDLIDSFSFAG
jgi:hypothetical protein